MLLEPSSDINWCGPHDQVVTQPSLKIEIFLSWKAERGLIGVWHNENLSQGTNTTRMKPNDAIKSVNLQ